MPADALVVIEITAEGVGGTIKQLGEQRAGYGQRVGPRSLPLPDRTGAVAVNELLEEIDQITEIEQVWVTLRSCSL